MFEAPLGKLTAFRSYYMKKAKPQKIHIYKTAASLGKLTAFWPMESSNKKAQNIMECIRVHSRCLLAEALFLIWKWHARKQHLEFFFF